MNDYLNVKQFRRGLESRFAGLGLDSSPTLVGLGLDSDSAAVGLGLDSDSAAVGLGLDSDSKKVSSFDTSSGSCRLRPKDGISKKVSRQTHSAEG